MPGGGSGNVSARRHRAPHADDTRAQELGALSRRFRAHRTRGHRRGGAGARESRSDHVHMVALAQGASSEALGPRIWSAAGDIARMPHRFVIALIKHETNTFSPLPTPLSAFGHGNGPAFGAAARERFACTNTPMAAYLDIGERERAEVVTPVAAEAWPSSKTSRATF